MPKLTPKTQPTVTMNIYLIGVRHENTPLYTSDDILQLLFEIKPTVIFIELPPSRYGDYFINKTHQNLESKAVYEYFTKSEKCQIVPVDLEDTFTADFLNEQERHHKRLEGGNNQDAMSYRMAMDNHILQFDQHGFRYANSKTNDITSKNCQILYEDVVKKYGTAEEVKDYDYWQQTNNRREYHMLECIYNYPKNEINDTAVLLTGYAHRHGIIEKLERVRQAKTSDINWKLYPYQE